MKRKVAIARSLIHNPSFLIYDEPTSGLDPMTSRYIIDYLRELRDGGKIIVLSAHNLYQVEAICDLVMILRRGKVMQWERCRNCGRCSGRSAIVSILPRSILQASGFLITPSKGILPCQGREYRGDEPDHGRYHVFRGKR